MLSPDGNVMTGPDPDENIIHVEFGRGGGKRIIAPPAKEPAPAPPPAPPSDPIADTYSRAEVARLFTLRAGRLRYWERVGFITPSAEQDGKKRYTFQDLISVRAAKTLLDQGVPLQTVRRNLDGLRRTLPTILRPLTQLRVTEQDGSLVVEDDQGAFEPETGQGLLDFRVDSIERDVVRLLRTEARSSANRQRAYLAYLEGCRHDEDDEAWEKAEEAYALAISLDPSLSNAYTNFGNLRYRQGRIEEAKGYYEQALTKDPAQPEALYNMGFLQYEHGDAAAAAGYFERAVKHDPSFADAHFNLAMTYEELGRKVDAVEHWRAYLELEPVGAWAEVAERHLSRPS